MRRIIANLSLVSQAILFAAIVIGLLGLAAALWTGPGLEPQVFRLRLIVTLGASGVVACVLLVAAIQRWMRPMEDLREAMVRIAAGQLDGNSPSAPTRESIPVKQAFDAMVEHLRKQQSEHEQSRQILAARSHTVDRLLEFSQTIQGAGKLEQIYAGLCHFLQSELGLAGLTILANEPDCVPATQVKACFPEDLMLPERPVNEMDTALCPCLRQNLPRHFRPDGSPVRCAIDASMRLDKSHPAYCIPFNIGGKIQVLVHMLLPPGQSWDEDRKQLAHTYVNTAHSTLISLHHLSEAEKQSMTDGLTGLYNRRSLESLMQREVALSERHGTPLSIVMIDMDKFKSINDEHGHAAGDHLLRTFADCVRITLRKTDLAFRYGGDEFVIALPQTPLVQAQAVVQKLRQAFAAVDFSDAIARMAHQPTLSIGVTERSKAINVLTLPNLLAAADQALYDAKASNRNCVKVYSPPQAA